MLCLDVQLGYVRQSDEEKRFKFDNKVKRNYEK